MWRRCSTPAPFRGTKSYTPRLARLPSELRFHYGHPLCVCFLWAQAGLPPPCPDGQECWHFPCAKPHLSLPSAQRGEDDILVAAGYHLPRSCTTLTSAVDPACGRLAVSARRCRPEHLRRIVLLRSNGPLSCRPEARLRECANRTLPLEDCPMANIIETARRRPLSPLCSTSPWKWPVSPVAPQGPLGPFQVLLGGRRIRRPASRHRARPWCRTTQLLASSNSCDLRRPTAAAICGIASLGEPGGGHDPDPLREPLKSTNPQCSPRHCL